MNREQRRKAQREQVGMVNLREVTFPWQMSQEECRAVIPMRIADNIQLTGHPFHHLTNNGAVVDADPTLEYMLSRLPLEEQQALRKLYEAIISPNVCKAIPVNRKYYGCDPFEKKA
jgi:hypothetical protein